MLNDCWAVYIRQLIYRYTAIFWGHMIKGVRVGGRVRVQKVGTKGAKKQEKKIFKVTKPVKIEF